MGSILNDKKKFWIAAAGLALLVLLMAKKWLDLASQVVATFEAFSAHPYWDVKRWSWGYGTAAPGATGTISKEKARAEMKAHILADYNILRPMIRRDLTTAQWAALLSFSYNLGVNNADNLVPNINAYNDAALEVQWKKYVYADGEVNPDLVVRRAREWALWATNTF